MSFYSLRKLFFFRSWTNFSITLFGFSTTGYFLGKWAHDKKFSHPIIQESLRIIGNNPQIIELAGYPISIQITYTNIAEKLKDQCHFTFYIRGPKGQGFVDLVGLAKENKQIELKEKNQYYIPSDSIQFNVFQNREKEEKLKQIPVLEDDLFWKIERLYIDVGSQGDFRITLADTNEKLPNKFIIQTKEVTDRKNLLDVKQESDKRKQSQPTSDSDFEEVRKYRQQELYRKIGNVRMVMIGLFIVGGMATYSYVQKNKRFSIRRSQLHLQSLELIKRNPYMRQEFGLNMKFNEQLRGQQIGEEAEFEADIMGNNKFGVAFIKGTRQKKTNEWQIQSIDVSRKSKDGKLEERKKII